MRQLTINAEEVDNAVICENDLWERDFEGTANGIAELLHTALQNSCRGHEERARGMMGEILSFLINRHNEHRQQSEWGDLDGIHERLSGRYGAVCEAFAGLIMERYGNITLLLQGLTDETLLALPESAEAVQMPSGKVRYYLREQQPGNRQQPATNNMQYASGDEWASLIPESINTERVRESLRKAIKRGWITITPQCLRWEGVSNKGRKAQLAYLCGKICGYRRKRYESGYSYSAGNQTRYQAFEKLFGVTRLDSALIQALEAKQPQAWRERIDLLFE